MPSVTDMDRDGRVLAEWVRNHGQEFAPLQIVDVVPSRDTDPDGVTIIVLSVVLAPPEDDDSWHTGQLDSLGRAVTQWGLAAGYEYPPHVHVQAADAA